MIKKIIKKYFGYFTYFYSHLKYRFFIGFLLSLFVGVLDGIGLAMMLPLLKYIEGESSAEGAGFGNLEFLTDAIESIGFPLTINTILMFILILFTFKGLFKFLESFYSGYVQQYFVLKLRKESIVNISKFSYKSFIKSDSGRIQNTLSDEVKKVSSAYNTYVRTLQNVLFVIVYLFLAFLSNPQFALLVVVAGGVTSLLFSFIFKRSKKLSSSLTRHGHIYHGLLIQAISNFKYLKATNRFDSYSSKLMKTVDSIESDNLKININQSFMTAIREPLVLLILVIVIFVEISFFNQSIGLIFLSLIFFYRALNFVLGVQNQWNNFLSLSASIHNYRSFLEELKEGRERTGTDIIGTFNGGLNVDNLTFAYKKDDPILKNINLQIKQNSTVAFVGESGSGKTTLVNILAGLLPAEKGSFFIDGKDSFTINLNSLQERIGYITQEAVIFDDNVFNNVTFWDEPTEENMSRFWKALKQASIFDFVNEIELKENAQLGNNGVMVSGGQKQRISIARELYKEIDILIMDEATSALDSETERSIQENIEKLKGKYTIIIVAHRLSTVKSADNIVLMSKGKIEDQGDFQSLVVSNDKFRRMVDLQEL